jgi:peptidoglycan/LPS O-acetylase OafA/YrhL
VHLDLNVRNIEKLPQGWVEGHVPISATLRAMETRPIGAGSDDAYTRFLDTKSFGSLDGLRAIAILGVLWHHAPGVTALTWSIADRGFLGVDLFFVISGFLIVTLLLREQRRSGVISLRHFYLRRFLRIFPAYYGTLAFIGIVVLVRHSSGTMALRHDLPYALAYVSNLVPMVSLLGITWSLSTEEQFYLVIPALEKYARKRLAILLPLAYVLVSLPPFGFFPSWNLPHFFRQTTFGPILLGVILAHVLDNPRGFAWFWRLLRHPLSPLFTLAVVIAACSYPADDISGWLRIVIHFAMLLLLASCVVREQHVLLPALRFWPLRRIGIVSYGIYLFHHLVMFFIARGIRHFGLTSKLAIVVALALATWGVAEASYRFYELRFLELKARFSK